MNKTKTGIITFHSADNLGAVLQAYALLSVLNEDYNRNAEIIDYRCSAVEASRYAQGNRFSPKKWLKVPYYKIKRKGFDNFRKSSLKMSDTIYTQDNIEKSNEIYDRFIAGSDQIWNLDCSGEDYTYFLDFVNSPQKKYAYSASIGRCMYNDEQKEHIAQLLSHFSGVSVREQSAKKIANSLGISQVYVHPDPVLLLSEERWKKVMSKRILKDNYVFVYLIENDRKVIEAAEKYAKENGCKIIYNKKTPSFVFHNSPAYFLSWIYYSECVFTNSFHATALSLVFCKTLCASVVTADGSINNRVAELLSLVNADNCILEKCDFKPPKQSVTDTLLSMKIPAIEYLNSIYK